MDQQIPAIIDGYSRTAAAWLSENRLRVTDILNSIGALLLRGFAVEAHDDFAALVGTFSSDVLDYTYRSTPRTALGSGLLTATEYPAGLKLLLHNENAYQRRWPLNILFCCLQPATAGGQTSIGSNVNITKRIDLRIRKKASDKGIMYIRNYHDSIDLPWREVFQTSSKVEVERYCAEHQIACEWTAAGGLRTVQCCQAMARHPLTKTMLWFNSAHMFHPSSLDQKTQQVLADSMTRDEFPRNAKYGDGSLITDGELENIREAFNVEERTFNWQRGDVLILDNMLMCHGRTPYKGSRRVLAAMCNLSSKNGVWGIASERSHHEGAR